MRWWFAVCGPDGKIVTTAVSSTPTDKIQEVFAVICQEKIAEMKTYVDDALRSV
jgi:hypothetical protein